MALVTETLPNLINGVSQQPPTLRRKSQSESQLNCINSVTDGSIKRSPTTHKAKITSDVWNDAFVQSIDRDANEKYEIVVTNNDIKVFDFNGTERTVNKPDGISYLATATPTKHIKALTVKDYTIITNEAQVVAMSPTTGSTRQPEALIQMKTVHKGGTYKVIINGSTKAEVTVTDATTESTPSSTEVAFDLYNKLLASSVSATLYGSIIHITSSSDFSIRGEYAGSDMKVIKGNVQAFSDLPSYAVDGFTVTVTGDPEDSSASAWVACYKGDPQNGEGVWEETVDLGLQNSFDLATMPHVLISEADGTFTFKRAEWLDRTVGTVDSNPEPSIVGQKIRSTFFHKARLCLISDENTLMSEDGEFFNVWRTTITTLLDTDPIDINARSEGISLLHHGIPFNSSIVLFSDKTQFSLSSDGILSPSKTRMQTDTQFTINPDVSPVASGRNVFFVTTNGQYSGISEYFVDTDSGSADAASITKHLPRYLPADLKKIAVNTNEDYLLVLPNNSNRMFVYQWYYGSGEGGRTAKLQSAMHEWSFGTDDVILNCDFIGSDVYFFIQRSDGVYLESMPLDPKDTSVNLPFNVLLDRRVHLQGTYDSGSNKTTWTLPYTDTDPYEVVRDSGFTHGKGQAILTERSGTSITTTGDLTESKVIIGRTYSQIHGLSEQVYRKDHSDSGIVETSGRLQLLNMEVVYHNTGYFRVEVTPLYRETKVHQFARIIGDGANKVGEAYIANGTFKFQIQSKSDQVDIKLINDSYKPSAFLSLSWTGQYIDFTKGY